LKFETRLESAWLQRLKLRHAEPLSNFDFDQVAALRAGDARHSGTPIVSGSRWMLVMFLIDSTVVEHARQGRLPPTTALV